MKIRTIALVGIAASALSTPAFASYPGWYLGLAVGYDHLEPVHDAVVGNGNYNLGYKDGAIFLASLGYKFDSGWRAEAELGFDEHRGSFVPGSGPLGGGTSTSSALFNLLYDFQLGDRWTLALGGGVGIADVNHYDYCGGKCVQGATVAFEWQAIGGLEYALTDDVGIFADYRFRSAELSHNFADPTDIPDLNHISQQQEHVGLLGIRWYLGWAPPPPPPPPPPPSPPPPPPPPVKTFIVFFDFDKSNLTAEAQSVVTEAVKSAKANGFVKVMVTGHTDTVGSDTYNQDLSVRRAESVKDEMVRQGMDGGSISIEGKSFHDPLVPTGPGVREPQNRRAVIDLGG